MRQEMLRHLTHSASTLLVAVSVALAAPAATRAGTGVWQTGGPFGDVRFIVQTVAVDPKTATTLYIGTDTAGIFKSTDAGVHWYPASMGLPHSNVQSLAIDPRNPATLYAALYSGGGLCRSKDGGATWIPAVELTGRDVNTVVVDSATPGVVYAGVNGGAGLVKSTDAGTTWIAANTGLPVPFLGVHSLAIDPVTPSIIYLGTQAGIYKSTDAAATWVFIDANDVHHEVRALAIDPRSPSVLYAGYFNGVIVSHDSGATWVNLGLPQVYSLVLDPSDPATLYVGTAGLGVVKSTSSGATWVPASTGLEAPWVFALAFDPTNPRTLYAAGTAPVAPQPPGLFTSTDAGGNWTRAIGASTLPVTSVAVDPKTPSIVYAGSSYVRSAFPDEAAGVLKSTDSGGTWVPISAGLPNTEVTALAVDPMNPAILFAGTTTYDGSTQNQPVFKSTDAGATWALSSTGLPFTTANALVIDPSTPTTLYVALGGLFKSTDGGGNWRSASLGLSGSVASIAIDPLTPATLYAGTGGLGVYKSTDGGSSWAAANVGLPPSDVVWAVAINPVTPTTLYVGTSASGVFKSVDSGATWVPANLGLTNLAVSALTIEPTSPSTLYAGTLGNGVFKSTNAGGTWVPDSAGLTAAAVTALALAPGGNVLYGGFIYGGVWRLRGTTGGFHTVTPCRVIDTRASDAPALVAGTARTFKVTGTCGIPATAASLSSNVTVTGATSAGHLRLYPGETPLPPNSSLNFEATQTRANNAVSLLGAAGDLAIFSAQVSGSVHVVVDVNGYFE